MEKYFEINNNGISIKCKIYCNDIRNVKDVVISFHGFCGSKENMASKKLAKKLMEIQNDIAVIVFDWPCHGKDVRQKLYLSDCNNYLNTLIDFIYSNFSVNNLYANATSFGGYLILKYIKENGNPFKKINLRCPAVNMINVLYDNILTEEDRKQLSKGKDVIAGFERKIRITPELINDLNTNDITKWDYSDIAKDILIIHGTVDETVPINAVEEFANANSIDFISIEGADHMFKNSAKMNEAIEYSAEFLLDEGLNQKL